MTLNPEYASALSVTDSCWGLFEDDTLSAVYDRTEFVWTVNATTEEIEVAGERSVCDRTMTVVAEKDNYRGC